MKIYAEIQGDEVLIKADSEGLRKLAFLLNTLAEDSVPIGWHIHLDDFNELEEGSCELVLERI